MNAIVETSSPRHHEKIIIIGGSSGIGLAVATAAAATKKQVIIASSNQKRIDVALQGLHDGCLGYAVDVTDEKQLRTLFEKTGAFDHLVYTAGENLMNDELSQVKIEEAKKYFSTRYWGAVAAVKFAAPYINKTGSIVLSSGIVSKRPGKGWALGASICSAMEGFTRAMAIELAPVRVNIVCPGVVKTNLWSNMLEKAREEMFEQVGEQLLVKRVGSAEDIAKTYLYLMEQEFSTGQTVVVDGGASLI